MRLVSTQIPTSNHTRSAKVVCAKTIMLMPNTTVGHGQLCGWEAVDNGCSIINAHVSWLCCFLRIHKLNGGLVRWVTVGSGVIDTAE